MAKEKGPICNFYAHLSFLEKGSHLVSSIKTQTHPSLTIAPTDEMAGYEEEYDLYADPNYDPDEGKYYNEDTGIWEDYDPNVIPPPSGAIVDKDGRLLASEPVLDPWPIEDYNTFVSTFNSPWMAAVEDGAQASKYVWPDIEGCVNLVRVDVFELDYPRCQQATTDVEESRRVRMTPNWSPVFNFFLLNMETQFTRPLRIESTGPPRRHKYIVNGKKNSRDTSTWVYKETVNGYIGADRIPGTTDFYVDFQDSPDRYYIADGPTPDLGLRRLYRFAGYPVTQYFILERVVVSDALESEGGSGLTCMIEKGPYLFMRKGWKIASSFFAFDKEMYGSNQYSVYSRQDPFPRINIAIGPIRYVYVYVCLVCRSLSLSRTHTHTHIHTHSLTNFFYTFFPF